MDYLIGIDDTDNLDSRGTGFRARQLGGRLGEAGLGELLGITRHQLYVHPDIPFTSHNSSACLVLRSEAEVRDALRAFCRDYLASESAEGSDAGLCIAEASRVAGEVVEFGRSAKGTVLTREQAHAMADAHGIHLEGVTGERIGVIGALSAVGLRRGGEDGRFIWLRGVRELSGTASATWLLDETGIDAVSEVDGTSIPGEAVVCVDPWPRPVMLGGRAVLLVQKARGNDAAYDWELLPKEQIKRF